MRWLFGIIMALALGWSAYWLIGSRAVENGLKGWFAERQADGWVAEYDSLDTRGFPNRFDTTVEGLMLADPASGLAWEAPLFQILALSYQPGHIIAAWPRAQVVATPLEKVTISNEVMRGSVVFRPAQAFALSRATFELEALALESTAGWTAATESGQFAIRETAARENTYDLFFEATGVKPASDILARMDPLKRLPDSFETLKLEATIAFDAPWDRYAIEDARPQPTRIELGNVQATWGDLDLRLGGTLDVDATGTPEGKITLRATNWREMLQIAVRSGLLPAQYAEPLERGLAALAGFSGNSETIDAPITFKNGRMQLGFVPLGPAPTLRLR
ncbi:DUF2125 domain-containing protein [Pseudoruegeria sp. SHC-113]|uniref:DUF2125 domain-containing protein n=1 Tax=Pseudoruegeria sp. SHC-113 TaxID=2855439 RepID=UPI0021BB3F6E|nr:DUF2125 domain-containing protein [Pseudoruegeria sp. SHC-113]MCT8159725.1 DUF2125 domain-containing protein [Pseudoruegeria sp. SHC-113]